MRADGWTQISSMGTPRIGHTATLLPDGRVLVVATTGELLVAYLRYDGNATRVSVMTHD